MTFLEILTNPDYPQDPDGSAWYALPVKDRDYLIVRLKLLGVGVDGENDLCVGDNYLIVYEDEHATGETMYDKYEVNIPRIIQVLTEMEVINELD